MQWEPPNVSVGDLATAAQLVSDRASPVVWGAERACSLSASGATSEEIALYISKRTTLWEISQLQQIELFHFGLQMAFSYTSRHINLITNDHIFH